ncbi:DUF2141 domain-containing protein [Falsiroseomonas sp. HW251]|uniref:DUF2141 domain-containing protein n=1 Tax=Falsiroseomonas sp. HW251 TaxID=3390998 RepID=UPI003D31DD78
MRPEQLFLRHAAVIAFVMSLLSTPLQAAGGSVTLVVDGVTAGEGTIRIAICRRERFLSEDADCPWGASVPASGSTVRVEIRDVPPGTYAVLGHQDSNSDGRINRWPIVGLPTEPLGFLAGRWHPRLRRAPTFDEAAIVWPREGSTLRVELYPTASWF